LTFQMKESWSFKIYGATHPVTQCLIPEHLKCQQHHSKNLISPNIVYLLKQDCSLKTGDNKDACYVRKNANLV
jgi:hypothetical protein